MCVSMGGGHFLEAANTALSFPFLAGKSNEAKVILPGGTPISVALTIIPLVPLNSLYPIRAALPKALERYPTKTLRLLPTTQLSPHTSSGLYMSLWGGGGGRAKPGKRVSDVSHLPF